MPKRPAPPQVDFVDALIASSIEQQVKRALRQAKAPARATSLVALVERLATEGEPLVRARKPATKLQIAALEKAVGHRLPAGYKQLLATVNYLDVGNVHLLGVGSPKRRNDVVSWRSYLRKELKDLVIDVPDEPALAAWCTRAADMTPLVVIGPNESFRFGEGVLCDGAGRFVRVGRDRLSDVKRLPRPERARFDLERFLIRAIEART